MVATAKITRAGQVTLPKKIREELSLHEGDLMSVETEDGAVVLRRKQLVDPVEAWLDSEEVQAALREVEEDLARGELPAPLTSGQEVLEYFRARREALAAERAAARGRAA